MTGRALFLDRAPGEARGVVTLGGRPERLLIVRDGDQDVQALGAVAVGRVRAVDTAAAIAFLDLGQGPDAALNLSKDAGRPVVGAAVAVEIRAEARNGKGAVVRWIGPATGEPRLLLAAPSLEDRLQAYAPEAEIRRGPSARAMADLAQDEAMAKDFPLPGGGRLWVEPTRALVAVDVDLGGRGSAPPKKATRAANLEAIAEAARALRLKGLGGLVVLDLVGRGHDATALLAAARNAFNPDNPGVAFGAVSRFGTLEFTIPRRARATVEILGREDGGLNSQTVALALLRALEREALADPGGRFEGVAARPVAEAARPALRVLAARIGERVTLRAEPGQGADAFDVIRL